jgi:hypothetical protein
LWAKVLVRTKEQVSGSPVEAKERSWNCRLQGSTNGLSCVSSISRCLPRPATLAARGFWIALSTQPCPLNELIMLLWNVPLSQITLYCEIYFNSLNVLFISVCIVHPFSVFYVYL